MCVCACVCVYLVDIPIGAASHPLDELKVVLGVSPLDLAAGPGKHVHGGSEAEGSRCGLVAGAAEQVDECLVYSVGPSDCSMAWK